MDEKKLESPSDKSDREIGTLVGQYASKVVSLLMERDCVIDELSFVLEETINVLNDVSKHTKSRILKTKLLLASSQIEVVLAKRKKCKDDK